MVHGLETSKAARQEDSTTPSAKAVGHTPLPWRLGDAAQHNADSIYAAASDGAELVADAYEMRRTDGDGEANAAFIVRACNSHYQLLSALKAASSSLHSILSTAYELSADQLSLACKECGALSPRNRDKSSFRTIHNAQCRTETAIRAEAEAEQAIAQAEGGI